MKIRFFGTLGLLAVSMSAGCASSSDSRHPRLTTLDQSLDPVRKQFNASAGKQRFVGIFAPS